MKKKYSFIVAAAGVGKRMGLSYPKQFLEVDGKPIFIVTLDEINRNELIDEIVVVTNKDFINRVKEECEKHKITKVSHIIAGGKDRQDSIYEGLQVVQDSEIIGVQDGVRPFIGGSYIENAYNELVENESLDGVVVGVPLKDTVKQVNENGFIVSTPDRASLVAAQTPQVFKANILKEAYNKAKNENFLGTDDSSLVERIKGKVKIIQGSYDNIKVTTPEDIHLLEKINKGGN